MHLRSVKLRGFKSFPDPVEVRLEPGVAVVVGPNGSGKSNVADAIIWAAGSLTPSELRAEKPDDVLFAGGAGRSPAEHCEVELVFDNEDGAFAELDYSEISIVRRLVRGGEGQYLVNRAPVRRTDLVELLADVGLGDAMHSIVSQGKVDAVLASKPADRRALIEEAAGLGKFKRRRHRAELKLARVAQQVERAHDVEAEVRKRLRPLALQATAAERAEKLAVEIAQLRARVAELDLADVEARRVQADERHAAAQLARRGSQERLQALLEERQGAEDELSDAAGRREGALASLYRLQGASERLGLRQEAAGALLARLEGDLVELEAAASARAGEDVDRLEVAAREAGQEARRAAADAGAAAERAREAHARLAATDRSAADEASAAAERLGRERGELERRLTDGTRAQETGGRSLVALSAVRERVVLRAESAGSLAAGLGRDAADAAGKRDGLTPAELRARADEAQATARAAAGARDEVEERLRTARERLAALDRALGEREGLPPAARALASEGERLVVSSLNPEPGSERAVAAALGWRAAAVLAEDARAGLALLQRARSEGLGNLAVVVGRDPGQLVADLPVVPLEKLLDARVASVTPEGFGYDPAAGELWFAGEAAEAVWLEMDARRRALADEVEELQARAREVSEAADEAAATAQAAEEAYAPVAHLRGAVSDPRLLGTLARAATDLHALLTRAAIVGDTLGAHASRRLTAAAEEASTLGAELRRLGAAETEQRRVAREAERQAREAELLLTRLGGGTATSTAGQVDREALAREAASLLAEAEQAAAGAAAAAALARAAEAAVAERAPRRGGDPELVRALVALSSDLVDGVGRAAAIAERLDAPARARVDAGARRTTELGERLRELGAAEVELRQQAEEIAQRLTAAEVELARLDAETAEARSRLESAGADEPAEGDDRAELQARVERLDARREALGRVNPLAREEYEEEKERLDDLVTQRRDLEQSLAELETLRDDLAATVERRFDETFAAVAANFEEVAATLFPGGEGRLRLVSPEDEQEEAEQGVEVELRPAGKRITRLSLLSGGEKALGAISFLFALFLARPCPFYLLDEVEAALDDTNIARFVELLRRYADRAQFVVVTHQKRTMEAADVLYGVTMGEDGVSQIVSRRLPQHEHAAA